MYQIATLNKQQIIIYIINKHNKILQKINLKCIYFGLFTSNNNSSNLIVSKQFWVQSESQLRL